MIEQLKLYNRTGILAAVCEFPKEYQLRPELVRWNNRFFIKRVLGEYEEVVVFNATVVYGAKHEPESSA